MQYRIKEEREKQNMSQDTLASLSGVSRSIISGLENETARTTTVATLYKISKALNVSITDIFMPSQFNQLNETNQE